MPWYVNGALTDIFTPEKRSWVMSRIRSKWTGIDLKMREILAGTGTRFEMYPSMLGNPDFAHHHMRIAVFCDGDFWHGFDYMHGKIPRQKFWREKILRNMERDRYITRKLRREGWSVLRFWEHDINSDPNKCFRKIQRKIAGRKQAAVSGRVNA